MQMSHTDYRPMCQLSQVVILCFYQRPLLATSEIYNTRWMEAHWKEAKLLKLLGVKEANQHKRLDSCFGSLLIPPMTLYLLLYMLMFFNLEHLGTEWETTWTAMDHHLIRLAVMLSKRLLHSSRDRFLLDYLTSFCLLRHLLLASGWNFPSLQGLELFLEGWVKLQVCQSTVHG